MAQTYGYESEAFKRAQETAERHSARLMALAPGGVPGLIGSVRASYLMLDGWVTRTPAVIVGYHWREVKRLGLEPHDLGVDAVLDGLPTELERWSPTKQKSLRVTPVPGLSLGHIPLLLE